MNLWSCCLWNGCFRSTTTHNQVLCSQRLWCKVPMKCESVTIRLIQKLQKNPQCKFFASMLFLKIRDSASHSCHHVSISPTFTTKYQPAIETEVCVCVYNTIAVVTCHSLTWSQRPSTTMWCSAKRGAFNETLSSGGLDAVICNLNLNHLLNKLQQLLFVLHDRNQQ